eukprot:12186798-Alexandrium_andersonii.AAC.1
MQPEEVVAPACQTGCMPLSSLGLGKCQRHPAFSGWRWIRPASRGASGARIRNRGLGLYDSEPRGVPRGPLGVLGPRPPWAGSRVDELTLAR